MNYKDYNLHELKSYSVISLMLSLCFSTLKETGYFT